jgi:hypothetical protein
MLKQKKTKRLPADFSRKAKNAQYHSIQNPLFILSLKNINKTGKSEKTNQYKRGENTIPSSGILYKGQLYPSWHECRKFDLYMAQSVNIFNFTFVLFFK